MKSEEMRIALIKSTIQTIAEVGIDHATTKLLATKAGLNEVYIYRIFGGKDQLFKETFNFIDREFATALIGFVKPELIKNTNYKVIFRDYFKQIWSYALEDKERCSFFIRYYYSRCYTNDMSKERKEIYAGVMKLFETAFPHGTDTWWLFNHVLDVTFSSAIKVLREEIPDTDETEEKIFALLYPAIEPHLKK